MNTLKILLISAVGLSVFYESVKLYLLNDYKNSSYVVQGLREREVAASVASIVRFIIIGLGIYFL